MKPYVRFVGSASESGPEHASSDRWAPVFADFEGALSATPRSPERDFGLATLRLVLGDRAARTSALRDLIDRYVDQPNYLPFYTCWLCGMATDVDLDRERLVRAMGRAQDSNPSVSSLVPRYLLADPFGVTLLRASHYAEAIERLEAFDKARGKGSNASSQLYRALALQRLGRAEDARRLVADARAWLAEFRRDPLHPSWPLARRPSSADRLEWWLLLREAEELVGRAPPSESPSQQP